MMDSSKYKGTALAETAIMREYMMQEGVQQYRDYYETDAEESKAFEYIDTLDNRGRIRFMEIFEDYSVQKVDSKEYVMIPKREFNPNLSVVANIGLDLMDFRDRVKPAARDLALFDVAQKYQKIAVNEIEQARNEFALEVEAARKSQSAEGYSSGELSEGRRK